MPPAIDMDYCIIVIEKLINPLTPFEQIMPLLRDLMDSVPHPEMKKLAQKIVDPELDQVEKRKVMDEFKNFNHGGENDFSAVNYNELIDKFIDPNLPDHEYKPTMKALLEGDLDQERKNQVINIINCHDKDQKANMVKRFKSSFDKDKEEKEKAEAERTAAKMARQAAKVKALEAEANLLEFNDDGMTLIMRMLDKKIQREKKTEIYDRLMEPDVDAEIKNLAIQMISLTKNSERNQYVEDFKKRREDERIAEEKRKKEEEQRKIEEENARKEEKMRRKNELLARKNKDEKLKKRELMIKMRADERKRESVQSGYVGPASVQEREEKRKEERERVKEELKRFREKAMKDMKKAEREDMRREGWMVLPSDGNLNFEVKVLVPDLNSNLSESERAGFEKALAKMKEKLADNKPSEVTTDRRNSQERVSAPAAAPAPTAPVVIADDDPEFVKFFEVFSNPSLTEKEEMNHIKSLIKDSKSALVRKLVVKLASVPGAGKSVIFKALAKKFAKKIPQSEGQMTAPSLAQTPVESTVKSKIELIKPAEIIVEQKVATDEKSEAGSKMQIEQMNVDKSVTANTVTKPDNGDRRKSLEENFKPQSSNIATSSDVGEEVKRSPMDSAHVKEMNKKMNVSGDSNSEEKVKKVKSNEEKEKDKKKRRRSGDDSESGERKKKKKKHKHKDDRDIDHEKSKKEADKENHKDSKEEIYKDKMLIQETSAVEESAETKKEILNPSKPVLSMTMPEIRAEFNLKKVDCHVKVKNLRKLYKVYKKQEERRNREWEEKLKKEQLEKEGLEKKEQMARLVESSVKSNGKDETSSSKSRSNSPQTFRSSSGKTKSRSPSMTEDKQITRSPSRSRSKSRKLSGSPSSKSKNKSKSPSKNRSISGKPESRSPSRPESKNNAKSSTKSRSNSGKPNSRSPSRSVSNHKARPASLVNSRSPSRSKSKARSPSKSTPPRSRSPSNSSRSKSRSRSRSVSRSRSRSNSDFSMSPSRSRSRSKSKSRSASPSRSKSISR